MSPKLNESRKESDCDCCELTGIVTYYTPRGDMWQCQGCKDKDAALEARQIQSQMLLTDIKKMDDSVHMKADIFTAKTVAAIELRGAIEADSTIADADKDFVYASRMRDRILHLKQVIEAKRASLIEDQNEVGMWQVNAQEVVAKLSAQHRAHFKEMDLNYHPPTVTKEKVVKTAKSGPSVPKPKKVTYTSVQRAEAAIKWNLPLNLIQLTAELRGVSPDEAGRIITESRAAVAQTASK